MRYLRLAPGVQRENFRSGQMRAKRAMNAEAAVAQEDAQCYRSKPGVRVTAVGTLAVGALLSQTFQLPLQMLLQFGILLVPGSNHSSANVAVLLPSLSLVFTSPGHILSLCCCACSQLACVPNAYKKWQVGGTPWHCLLSAISQMEAGAPAEVLADLSGDVVPSSLRRRAECDILTQGLGRLIKGHVWLAKAEASAKTTSS